MCKCKIQWIDDDGQPTPDENEAIGFVKTKTRDEVHHGRRITFTESEWFPICAKHAERLRDAGMHIWEFKAI